jgi:hypothetical protein
MPGRFKGVESPTKMISDMSNGRRCHITLSTAERCTRDVGEQAPQPACVGCAGGCQPAALPLDFVNRARRRCGQVRRQRSREAVPKAAASEAAAYNCWTAPVIL